MAKFFACQLIQATKVFYRLPKIKRVLVALLYRSCISKDGQSRYARLMTALCY